MKVRILVVLTLMCYSVSSVAVTDVAIQLKGYHQAQFTGFYVALDAGMHAQDGLNVSLAEGRPGMENIDLPMASVVDSVVDSPENLLTHRQAGDNAVAIAVFYQRNPLIFLTKTGSGISGKDHGRIGSGQKRAVILRHA